MGSLGWRGASAVIRRAVLAGTWAWLALLVAAPAAVVAVFSILGRTETGVGGGFTPDAWRSVLTPDVAAMFLRSAAVGAVVTLACLVIGYPAAAAIAGCPPAWRTLLLGAVVVPAFLTAISRLTALKLIFQWAAGPEFHSTAAVVIGLVQTHLPFMILPLVIAIERVPRGLLEAAADLGAGPWARFRRVLWPLTIPGAAAGSALVFIPSFGAFVGPTVLGSVRDEMVGVHIDVLSRSNLPAASAISLMLMASVLLILAGVRRGRRGA